MALWRRADTGVICLILAGAAHEPMHTWMRIMALRPAAPDTHRQGQSLNARSGQARATGEASED